MTRKDENGIVTWDVQNAIDQLSTQGINKKDFLKWYIEHGPDEEIKYSLSTQQKTMKCADFVEQNQDKLKKTFTTYSSIASFVISVRRSMDFTQGWSETLLPDDSSIVGIYVSENDSQNSAAAENMAKRLNIPILRKDDLV
tara:strand:- start:855 stop:1277 length:423 start_codon:yes stop_codon:yes gene_type:complete